MSHRDIRQILGLELMKKVYKQVARRAGDSLETAREAPEGGRQAVGMNGSQSEAREGGVRSGAAASVGMVRGRAWKKPGGGRGKGRGRGRGKTAAEVASGVTYEVISDSDEDLGTTSTKTIHETTKTMDETEAAEGATLLAPSLTLARCG